MSYRNCKWCRGTGCIQCETEMRTDYEQAFGKNPKPLASIRYDDAEGMAKLARAMSPAAIARLRQEAEAEVDALKQTKGLMGAMLNAAPIAAELREKMVTERFNALLVASMADIQSSVEPEAAEAPAIEEKPADTGPPPGQSCATCLHCKESEYFRAIVSCAIAGTTTTRRNWCASWKPLPTATDDD